MKFGGSSKCFYRLLQLRSFTKLGHTSKYMYSIIQIEGLEFLGLPLLGFWAVYFQPLRPSSFVPLSHVCISVPSTAHWPLSQTVHSQSFGPSSLIWPFTFSSLDCPVEPRWTIHFDPIPSISELTLLSDPEITRLWLHHSKNKSFHPIWPKSKSKLDLIILIQVRYRFQLYSFRNIWKISTLQSPLLHSPPSLPDEKLEKFRKNFFPIDPLNILGFGFGSWFQNSSLT